MAEAPADLSTGDNLEQKILQVLSDACGPVKIGQLLKKCQVPKKTLNQVLYRLKKEGRVSSPEPAVWSLGGDVSRDGAPAIPEDSTAQPCLDEERILRFLEANGPQRALHIAKALEKTTAKEVNPLLYSMKDKHLLSYDGKTWKIYRSRQESQEIARSGVRQESSAIIYQQNPINMICQGANSHISIANSKAIQIGHGNVMSMHCGDPGLRTPHHVPLPMPEDASAQDTPPGAHGAQHIHMDKSMLRRVQLGHGNEMNLMGDPGEDPTYSFSGSPPGMAAAVTPQYPERTRKPESLPGENHDGKTYFHPEGYHRIALSF